MNIPVTLILLAFHMAAAASASICASRKTEWADWNYLTSYGQSLSVGWTAKPVVTEKQEEGDFGGLQIIQNAVVGSSSPAQGTKARPTHSRRRTNQPDTGSRNGRIMLHQAEQTTGSPGYGSFAARTVHSFLQRNPL